MSQKTFLAVVFFHCTFLLIERVYALVYSHVSYGKDGQTDAEDVQLDELWMFLLMVATTMFMVWFSVESVLKANAFEVGAFFGTSFFLFVRVTADYACFMSNNREDSSVLECGTPGLYGAAPHIMFSVSLLLNIVEWALAAAMVDDLRWTKYKAIGSDVKVRSLYRHYELYSAVRKMDLQFSSILVITALVFFSSSTADITRGLPPTVLLLFVEVLWDRAGVRAVKQKDSWAMYAFWILSVVLPVYVIVIGMCPPASLRDVPAPTRRRGCVTPPPSATFRAGAVSLDESNEFFDALRAGESGKTRSDRLAKISVLAFACVANRISTFIISVLLWRQFDDEEYSVLMQLFRQGFTKYGKQRVTEQQEQQDVVNPVPDGAAGAPGSAPAAVPPSAALEMTQGPITVTKPAQQADSSPQPVHTARLAALYAEEGDGGSARRGTHFGSARPSQHRAPTRPPAPEKGSSAADRRSTSAAAPSAAPDVPGTAPPAAQGGQEASRQPTGDEADLTPRQRDLLLIQQLKAARGLR